MGLGLGLKYLWSAVGGDVESRLGVGVGVGVGVGLGLGRAVGGDGLEQAGGVVRRPG